MSTPLFFDQMQTGDVLLVHGRYFLSELIESILQSKWSHSAMIVKAADFGKENEWPPVLLWESNSLTNLPDLLTGKYKTGPMLVDLKERLQTTLNDFKDVEFAYRPLLVNRTPGMMKAFADFAPTVSSATFPDDLQMAAMLAEGYYLNRQADEHLYFCSELLAASYIHMKLLTHDHPYNYYSPKDFSDESKLSLLNDALFGPQIDFNTLPG